MITESYPKGISWIIPLDEDRLTRLLVEISLEEKVSLNTKTGASALGFYLSFNLLAQGRQAMIKARSSFGCVYYVFSSETEHLE